MVDFSARGGAAAPAPPTPGGAVALDLDEPSPEPGPLPTSAAPRAARPAAPTPGSFELDDLVIGSPPPAPAGTPAATRPPSTPRLELDGLDLGAPATSSTSAESMTRGPGGEFVDPDAGSLEDMPGVIDLALPAGVPTDKKPEAAFNLDEAPPVSLADELEEKAAPSPLRKGAKPRKAVAPADAKKRRLLMLGGGGVALLVLVGVGVGVFGKSLLGGPRSDTSGPGAAGDQALRAAILEDNYPALRDVATKLQAGGTPSLQQRGLAAQALLLAYAAHQGPRDLVGTARDAIGALPAKGPFPPEYERGRGLLAVVEGKAAEGERLLAAAPADAKDGVGQLVAAWALLQAGKAKEAEPLFQKAAAAAGSGPALYGAGAAREAAGDLDGARDLYEQAATKAPLHAAAALGAARTTKDAAAREAALRRFIQQKAAKASPGEKAEALGLIGEIALGGGQLDEAEKQFDEALKLERTAARAQNGLAAVLFEGGRHEAALKRYQEIRRVAPKSLEAVIGAARCLLELGRLLDADEPVAAAERMAPNDARVLALRGLRQELTDTPAAIEGAVKSYLAALKADDRYAPGYALLARAYLKLKRDADAFSALKQGQAVVPQSAVIDNAFGEAYLRTGDAARAEERFRAALAKNPNLHVARFNLGAALEKSGHLEQAEKEYALLAEKVQRFPGLPERRARLYQKMGRVEQALQSFDQALRAERPPVTLRLAAADAFVEHGARSPCFPPAAPASQPAGAPPTPPAAPPPPCYELARVTVDTVLTEDGRSAQGNNLMGRALAGLGRPDEGLTFARRAIALDPKRAEYHLHVGEILEQLGRADQALQELDLAVGGAPTLVGAYVTRGRIFVKRRQFREALVELGKAVQRDRTNAAAYRLMGEAFSGLRQLPQAIEAYQNAVKRAPHDAEAQYRLGEAYADAERRGPAVDAFKRALQLASDKVPWAAEAHRRLGFIHKEGGARGGAVAEFKRYLELRPDAPDRGEILQQIRFLE
ncbi:MAG: tetratricopeptide repeat protein [Deltaproteobacteria bacterium]|nr:tetratricopeptide repeat protein [Deltaproteobacteria bacterium]